MSLFDVISSSPNISNITLLIQILINQYLSTSFCITIVSEEPINIKHNLSFIYLNPNETTEALTEQLLEVSEMGCSDYIVFMSDLEDFMTAFDRVSRRGNIRRSNRKLLLIPNSNEMNETNESLKVLFMRESSFVANMLLIIRSDQSINDCEIYDLIIHEFMKRENNAPVFLDQWSSCTRKFQKNVNLFPHDISNLKGKVLKIASFTYKPYSFLDLDPKIVSNGRDGLELRIIDEFCRWVNCTIDIINENVNQWGEILDNSTGIGVIGSVFEDRADMGMAALYSWYEEFIHLDFSASGVRSAVTCVAPSPKLITSWEMPLLPFHPYMWYAVLLTFVYACIVLTFAKGWSTDKVLLTVFGMMISQSQHKMGVEWQVRGVTGWLLVAGLVLISAYGAGLAATFTVPKYEPSIDTIQDLVDRKMEWGATHDAWIFSIILSNEPLIKSLVRQFRIKSATELERRSFTGDMAFSIEKLPAGYFAIGDYITKDALLHLTVMLENFYYELCVVMLRKSSPYTEKISALIGRLHETGLLLSWETQVALKYLNYEVQQEVKLSRSKNDVVITALSLHHVVGIFILYFTGVILAVLMFIAELLIHKIQRKMKTAIM